MVQLLFFAEHVLARDKQKWPNIYWFQHEQNHLYHSQCANRKFYENRELCGNPSYLDGICRAIPIQVTKLDRINLKFMTPLLNEADIGDTTKILYLVRDPRSVINSRKDFPWCVAEPNCINPKYLCQDMVQDYYEAKELVKKESKKFKYEAWFHFNCSSITYLCAFTEPSDTKIS